MLTLVAVVFGLVAYPKIGVDQYPKVEFPMVTVLTILPGADPETIEQQVTKPLEEALNTVPGLDTLRSVNVENVSQVIVRFDLDVDADVAAQDVRDKVQATLSKLPREIETPVVQKLDLGSLPVVTLAVSAPVPIERLTQLAEDQVKPSLQQFQGVGSVDLLGGRKREITIELDPQALKGVGLAASDVVQMLKAQNLDAAYAWLEYSAQPFTQKLLYDVTAYIVANPAAKQYMTPAQAASQRDIADYGSKVNFWQWSPRREKYQEIWNEVKAAS
jgi:HAE1 family hydrophobic/amphiphilic exporter-1